MARRIEVEITGDSRSLERAFGRSVQHSNRLGRALSVGLHSAAIAGGVAIAGLGVAMKIGFDEFKNAAKVSAQTNAVIKSTGGIANVTAKHVDALGLSMLKKTGIDDEAIKSGENMLLTFKNIHNELGKGNDIFDQATRAVTDMDTALSQGNSTQESLAKTAIRVGKALNDPIKGVTALRRVGVTFNDTQMAMIKHMVDTGHAMDAQKLILRELRLEFGGSAEAIGRTLPGQLNILKETFRNNAAEVMRSWMPMLLQAAQFALPLMTRALVATAGYVRQFADIVRTHMPQIRSIATSVAQAVANAWRSYAIPAIRFARQAAVSITDAVRANWPQIRAIAVQLGSNIRQAFNTIRAVIQAVLPIVRAMMPLFRATFAVMVASARAAGAIINAVLRGVAAAANGLKAVTSTLAPVFRVAFRAAAAAVRVFGSSVSGVMRGVAAAINGVISAVRTLVRWLKSIPHEISVHINIPTPHIPHLGIPFHTAGGFIGGTKGEAVPIMAHAGEVVLNAQQQDAFGGPEVFRQMFGFQHGGIVPPRRPRRPAAGFHPPAGHGPGRIRGRKLTRLPPEEHPEQLPDWLQYQIAAAQLTPSTSDDLHWLRMAESYLVAQLADPRYTFAQKTAIVNELVSVRDQIKQITGAGTATSPDLEAQLAQAREQARVAGARAGLAEAFVATGVFGGNGAGGGGGVNVTFQSTFPPTPQQAREAAAAVADGASQQGYRPASSVDVGI